MYKQTTNKTEERLLLRIWSEEEREAKNLANFRLYTITTLIVLLVISVILYLYNPTGFFK